MASRKTPAKPTKQQSRQPSLLTEEERIRVHCVLANGLQKAASTMGVPAGELTNLMRRKDVRNYSHMYTTHFLKAMAAYELSRIARFPVTKEDVLARLLNLALMSPEETKGSILGQVEALSKISELLGLKFSPRDADQFFKDKTIDQIRNYAKYGTFDPSAEEKKLVDEHPSRKPDKPDSSS